MGTPIKGKLTPAQLVAAGFGTPAKTTLAGRPNKPKKRKKK